MIERGENEREKIEMKETFTWIVCVAHEAGREVDRRTYDKELFITIRMGKIKKKVYIHKYIYIEREEGRKEGRKKGKSRKRKEEEEQKK